MIAALGTSSSELKSIVHSLGLNANFLGVFDKSFPGFLDITKPSFAIVNTGDVHSGGVHWIAFAFEPHNLNFFMFDPFGWSKKELLEKYHFQYDRMVKGTAKRADQCINLIKSKEAVQCPCSAACGLFCVLFLYSFYYYPFSPMEHNPVIDIIVGVPHSMLLTEQGIFITHDNQRKLYQFLYANCMYFRDHVTEIKENTRLNAIKIH